MLYREILHIGTNKVFSTNTENVNDASFQAMTESQILSSGFYFVKNYIPPFDYTSDRFYKIESDFKGGLYSDFKQAREEMKLEALNVGFNNLVIEQIEILSKWFAIPSSISLQYYDLLKLSEFGKFFDDNSKESRRNRRDCVIRFLRNVVPVSQLFPIIVKAQVLLDNYVSYGIEGTTIQNINGVSDPVGIYDYLNSTSSYSSSGFLQESITPQFGYTKVEVKDIVMDIFENGNYI